MEFAEKLSKEICQVICLSILLVESGGIHEAESSQSGAILCENACEKACGNQCG